MGLEDWTEKTWPICLSGPPQVAQMGIGVHGRFPSESYRLPDLWCLHLYRYEASVEVGGQAFPILPGFVGVIPSDTPMHYRFLGRSPHLYAHFRTAPAESRLAATPIPAMQDFGDDFGRLYEQLEQVLHGEARQREARLWDVLWQVASRAGTQSAPGFAHPAVGKTVRAIERRLGETLRVESLALEAGISEGYLARLFRDALGMSVAGYIRRRRIERAAHLLRNSTLPIKTVAAWVGLPDLHHFNKAVHQCLGQSPSALRRAACAEERAACPDEPIVI